MPVGASKERVSVSDRRREWDYIRHQRRDVRQPRANPGLTHF